MRLPLPVAPLLLLLGIFCMPTASAADDDTAVLDVMPNIGFYEMGSESPSMPPTWLTALKNGALCELDRPTLKNDIVQKVHKGGNGTAEDYAKAIKDTKADCSVKETDWEKCLCDESDAAAWCVALKVKATLSTATKGACSDSIDLSNVGFGTLTKELDLKRIYKGNDKADITKAMGQDESSLPSLTRNEAEEAAKFFCDAANPDVEKRVKEYMMSNGAFLFLDQILAGLVFGDPDIPKQDETCKDEEFKNHELGKCLCARETGNFFCIFKFLGVEFKKAGYLACGTGTAPAALSAPNAAAAQSASGAKFDSSKKFLPKFPKGGAKSPAAGTSLLLAAALAALSATLSN